MFTLLWCLHSKRLRLVNGWLSAFHTESLILALKRYLLKSSWHYLISQRCKKSVENIKASTQSTQAPGLELLVTAMTKQNKTNKKQGNGLPENGPNHIQYHKLVSLEVGWQNRNINAILISKKPRQLAVPICLNFSHSEMNISELTDKQYFF